MYYIVVRLHRTQDIPEYIQNIAVCTFNLEVQRAQNVTVVSRCFKVQREKHETILKCSLNVQHRSQLDCMEFEVFKTMWNLNIQRAKKCIVVSKLNNEKKVKLFCACNV